MAVDWKSLEGKNWRLDVGTSLADALADTTSAYLHLTTDGNFVMCGQMLASYFLGDYSGLDAALDAAKEPTVSGNNSVTLIRFTVSSAMKSGLIVQQVGDDDTLQLVFWDGELKKRRIQFTDTSRTAVSSAGDSSLSWSLFDKVQANATDCTQAKADIKKLQTLVRELGNFDSESAALAAIGAVSIASDQTFAIAHCTYQGEISVILVQNVENDYCRQVIFNKDKIFHRGVYFTSGERTAISYAEDWTPLFSDRLHWDASTHKYVPSLFGLTFNAANTDAIPLATTTQHGLMTAAQVKQLDTLQTRIAALEQAASTTSEQTEEASDETAQTE